MSDQELIVNNKIQKLPPQVVDIEKCVLGALMLEKDSITVIVDILKADYFYDPANRKIFAAILDLFNANLPIDIKTVVNKLKKIMKNIKVDFLKLSLAILVYLVF